MRGSGGCAWRRLCPTAARGATKVTGRGSWDSLGSWARCRAVVLLDLQDRQMLSQSVHTATEGSRGVLAWNGDVSESQRERKERSADCPARGQAPLPTLQMMDLNLKERPCWRPMPDAEPAHITRCFWTRESSSPRRCVDGLNLTSAQRKLCNSLLVYERQPS